MVLTERETNLWVHLPLSKAPGALLLLLVSKHVVGLERAHLCALIKKHWHVQKVAYRFGQATRDNSHDFSTVRVATTVCGCFSCLTTLQVLAPIH